MGIDLIAAEPVDTLPATDTPGSDYHREALDAWNGTTVVIKYGGAAMTDPELKRAFLRDVALLWKQGVRAIVVHGGGNEVTGIAGALGIETRFIDGQRYTDGETMRVVQMVLAGGVNKEIVSMLNDCGCQAIGLCGIDGGLLTTARHAPNGVDLGQVGYVTGVKRSLLEGLLDGGLLPVIAPIGRGENGEAHNINADLAATAIAKGMAANRLIYLTDVEGIKKGGKVLPIVQRSEGLAMIDAGDATGGMIPKLQGGMEALDVLSEINIVDGRRKGVLLDLLAGEPIGTRIINDIKPDRKDNTHD